MHRRHLHQQQADGRLNRTRRRARGESMAGRHLIRLGSFVAATLLLGVVVVTLGHQRLRQGPVSLGPLTPIIADRLGASAEGLNFHIGRAMFALGAPGEVSGLRLSRVRVTDDDGMQVADVPELSMRFLLWDLAFGRLEPTEIRATGISAVIERDVRGRIRLPGAARAERAAEAESPVELAAEATMASSDTASALVALLAANAPGEGPLARLEKVTASGVDVVFRDHFTGQNWQLIDAEFTVEREADRDVGRLTGRVAPPPRAVGALADPGGTTEAWPPGEDPFAPASVQPAPEPLDQADGPSEGEAPAPSVARFALEGQRRHDDGQVTVRLGLSGLPIAHVALAAGAPMTEAATFGDLRAGMRGEAVLASDGALISFRGGARMGPGALVGLPDPFGRIDRAALSLSVDEGAPGLLNIRRLELTGPAGRASASGRINRLPGGEGVSLALDIDEVVLQPEAGFARPMVFGAGGLTAHFLPGAGRIELEALSLEGADTTLTAEGAAEWGDEGPDIAVSFATGPLSLDGLLAGWPVKAGANARKWVLEHLSEEPAPEPGATPASASASASAPGPAAPDPRPGITAARGAFWSAPGKPPELTLDFAFQGLRGEVLRGMPAITGAVGRGRVGLDRFDMALSQGVATPPGGEAIDLAGSTFSAPDLDARETPGLPTVRARGRIADVLSLIDQPPLRLISKFGMDLSSVAGEVTTTAKLSFPLIADLKLEQLEVEVAAALSDVVAPIPGGAGNARAASLSLDVDADGLRLAGAARIEGLPARIDWHERFAGGTAADPQREVTVSASLDAGVLERLGVEGLTLETGAAPARLTLRKVDANQPDRFSLSADLKPTALAIPFIAWTKPAGAPGKIAAEGRIAADGSIQVDRLSGEGGGLALSGAARIGPDGTLRRLRLDQLALDGLMDVGLRIQTQDAGRIDATVDGDFIDLGELWRRAESGLPGDGAAQVDEADEADDAPGPGGPTDKARAAELGRPFAVSLKVARARLVEGIELSAVDGQVTRDDGVTRAELSGEVNGGQRADLRYRIGRSGGGRLTIDSADAGALIRDLGLSDEVSGGVLKVRGRLPPGSDALVGVAEADGIRVGGEEALSGVLERASRDGFLRAPEAATPTATGGYVFDTVRAPFRLEGKRIRLTDALATGPMLALKVSGDYDLGGGALDLSGVLTPAYAINGILNSLPIVGFLLGGEGEGILAMNFSVTGSASDPDISVNPFSILTPGILRDLFSGFGAEDDDGTAPDGTDRADPGR